MRLALVLVAWCVLSIPAGLGIGAALAHCGRHDGRMLPPPVGRLRSIDDIEAELMSGRRS